mmetsp:Transcript_18886/g.26897  ORF Transcript_18886/g.26897 Transcript_18886/m.26897 type:complete len:581 (+) Transcript_18886:160-1902(+)
MAPRNNSSSSSAKPKRVRRKCTAPGCTNRVVQGGVCVTHGAKRKLCSYEGCSKAVKLAGFCSTHGPTRKKCDYIDPSSSDPCARVAVQGGRCLSHGARRRFCAFPGKEVCTKNAVHGGYCKKHHDLVQDASGMLVLQSSSPSIKNDSGDGIKNNAFCMPVGALGGSVISGTSSASVSDHSIASSSATTGILGGGMEQQEPPHMSLEYEEQVKPRAPNNEKSARKKKSQDSKFPTPQHKRGLSIFDEMPTVDAIISMGEKQRDPTTDAAAATAAAEGIASLASQHKNLKQEPEHPYPPQQPCADSNKTPNSLVTFADGTRQAQEAPATAQPSSQENSDEVCLQNPSCTCEACRSPTLAIFEQMLQASHKLERGEIANDIRYAGLSPPKLSPSKRYSSKYNKSVKFPVELSSSSTCMGGKVSASNFGVTSSIPNSRRQSPAATALAAAVELARDVDYDETSHVRRSVSHDIDSPRSRYYHHQYYGYPPSHNYHPSQYPHHNQHPHQYYYQQQPYPQHYYRHYEPRPLPPPRAPGTPILSDDPPKPAQSPSQLRREKRKQQKRLLPKPRGKEMEHLFVPSEAN